MGLLSLAIWLPIAFGVLLLALGRDEQAHSVRWIALIGALASFLVTIPLYTGFTLGTAEISPISLANAYATIAARGKRCDPIILKSAVGKDGKSYDVPSANCQQVIPEKVADTVADVLRGPFNGGTASAAMVLSIIRYPFH